MFALGNASSSSTRSLLLYGIGANLADLPDNLQARKSSNKPNKKAISSVKPVAQRLPSELPIHYKVRVNLTTTNTGGIKDKKLCGSYIFNLNNQHAHKHIFF